jgi:hypothetical protein
LREARPVLAGFDLGHERGGLAAEWIQIDVVTRTAEARGAGQGIPLRMNANVFMAFNKLALDTFCRCRAPLMITFLAQ